MSLLLVVWLTDTVRKGLNGRVPPWWTVAIGYLWANLHGMWILVPLAFIVLAVGAVLDRDVNWRPVAVRSGYIAVLTTVSAALTPVGPKLVYWPLVVRDAASDISEWQPTVLTGRYSLAYALLFFLWILAITRTPARAPRSEVLWVLCVFAFSLQAGRNVAPAIIMLAPFVALALERAYGERLARLTSLTFSRVAVTGTLIVAAAATAHWCFCGQHWWTGFRFDHRYPQVPTRDCSRDQQLQRWWCAHRFRRTQDICRHRRPDRQF